MFAKFLKNYGKSKIMDGVQGLNDAIVSWDPEGAVEAEIQTMEENFDEINKQYSQAKTVWQKEDDEARAIVAVRDQRVAAAESISAQIDAGNDDPKLVEGLNQLLDALEEMQDDIELEVEEADDAKELMDELGATVELYAKKLKTARTDMRKASNAMQKAKMQEERAKEKAARAAQAAGLKTSAGGLSSALESMNRQAQDAKDSADAAKRKADLLGVSKVEENDVVAAAMAAASGEAPKATSAKDRLAALKR
jgi:hypothetical protein